MGTGDRVISDSSQLSGKLRPLGFKKYQEYLASDHWQTIRREYAESGLAQDCACGAHYTALHHTTYDRLGYERLTELRPVCNRCHRKIHNIRKRKRKRRTSLQVFYICPICAGTHLRSECDESGPLLLVLA